MSESTSSDLDLWQQTLAAEHAAIWGLGLVGATGSLAEPAAADQQIHRSRRTRCADAVVALGGTPVASAPAYDLTPPGGEGSARNLAAGLDQGCSVAYAALVGAGERRTRLLAAQWLRESAIATWRWNAALVDLPGLQ